MFTKAINAVTTDKADREGSDRNEDPIQEGTEDLRGDFFCEKDPEKTDHTRTNQDRISQTAARGGKTANYVLNTNYTNTSVVVVVVVGWIHIGVGGGGWKVVSSPVWIHGFTWRCL